MVDLIAKTPLLSMKPVKIGAVTLSEVDLGVLTSLAPYRGRDKDLSIALKAAHGMTLPGPGKATGKAGARAIWFGNRAVLLAGPAPESALGEIAAVVDQSDAWTAVRLEGPEADQVLARLTPIDLRASAFRRGHTARTDLQHMMASITRLSDQVFLILVFRSMGDTLVHDLCGAMEGVAARQGGG